LPIFRIKTGEGGPGQKEDWEGGAERTGEETKEKTNQKTVYSEKGVKTNQSQAEVNLK